MFHKSFDDWFYEIENFACRAERLTSDKAELEAAFDAGKTEAEYLRSLVERLMSEVRPYCRPSLVQYDVFPVFKEAVDYFNEQNQNSDI